MSAYSKNLENMETKLAKAVEREAWTEANGASGFVDGMKGYYFAVAHEAREREIGFAEWNYKRSVDTKDYGRAAYWLSYQSGMSFAETLLDLDAAKGTK